MTLSRRLATAALATALSACGSGPKPLSNFEVASACMADGFAVGVRTDYTLNISASLTAQEIENVQAVTDANAAQLKQFLEDRVRNLRLKDFVVDGQQTQRVDAIANITLREHIRLRDATVNEFRKASGEKIISIDTNPNVKVAITNQNTCPQPSSAPAV